MRCKCFLTLFLLFGFLFAEDIVPDQTIDIPMRDGTLLPTDLYFPEGKRENLPCVLVRTPSGRAEYRQSYALLAKAGYLVSIQDARNSVVTDTVCLPWICDGWGELQDGYDTVQWLAKSPLTNGKIGTLGFSAMGISQLLLAPANPPNLCCQYIGFAAASLYDHGLYIGGQMRKMQVENWMGKYASHPEIMQLIQNSHALRHLCSQVDTRTVADRVTVPAIHYGGWYDTFLQGTIEAYITRQEQGGPGAKDNQKLIIGPWTHHWPRSYAFGDFEIPELGRQPPFDISTKSWFDYHLKGKDNGIDQLPNVIYYVMGPLDGSRSSGNVWKTADHWPIPATQIPLYLKHDKTLVRQKSKAPTISSSFTYDPENPVPTLGGKNLFLEAGPKDQRTIESREDVIVFTSKPLKEDLEVTGQITCILYAVSDRPDTDIAVRLTDVYPDGRSILISDSIHRLQEKSDSVKEIELDLWSISQVFAKGHKIRLSITGSNYPRFEKNLNLEPETHHEGPHTKAKTTIYMGKEHPSRLILPVVNTNKP